MFHVYLTKAALVNLLHYAPSSQGYGSVFTVGLFQKFVPFFYKTVSNLFAYFRAITRF